MKHVFVLPSPAVTIVALMLLVLNGLLLSGIWSDFRSPPATAAVAVDAEDEPETQLLDLELLVSSTPLQASEAALKRPLFSSSRRPYEAPPPQVEAVLEPATVVDEPLPSFKLYGVVVDEPGSRALLQVDGAVSPEWMSLGQTRDGWRLSFIGPSDVTLEKFGQKLSVDLYPGP